MGNPFCHLELHSTDTGKAKEFYGSLFDWKLDDMDMGGGTYTMVNVGEGTGGGIMQNPVPGAPSHWLAYVEVADLDASIAKAKSLGGTVVQERMEVPNMGWFSVITDPTGAAFGLWQTMGS